MKKNQEKFERFCTLAFAKNTLILEESEKKHFQELREIEGEDYKFRKKIFWPIWGLSLLLLDQLITIPATKSNKSRIFFNIVAGIPFISIVCTGLIFYNKQFESHEYAMSLCEKYNSCKEDST